MRNGGDGIQYHTHIHIYWKLSLKMILFTYQFLVYVFLFLLLLLLDCIKIFEKMLWQKVYYIIKIQEEIICGYWARNVHES